MAQEYLKSDILIPNGYRLSSLFEQQYPIEIISISKFLNELPGKVNIMCDCWTDYSFSHFMGKIYLILGVCCSFVYRNKIRTLALSFEPTQNQCATDLAKLIENCLNTYKIGHKVHTLVTDNGISYNNIS